MGGISVFFSCEGITRRLYRNGCVTLNFLALTLNCFLALMMVATRFLARRPMSRSAGLDSLDLYQQHLRVFCLDPGRLWLFPCSPFTTISFASAYA